MSDSEPVPIPVEEQLQRIDEAFEAEEPDASIAVAEVAASPLMNSEWLMSLLAVEEKFQSIEKLKQDLTTSSDINQTTIAVAKITVWGMIGWFALVGLIILAYMVGVIFGYVLLPENALVGLIATVAFATLIGAVGKLIRDLKS